MPVIVVGTEKNFAALKPRLLAGKASPAAVSEVTAVIAAANPHVDLAKLEPGTVITIPDDTPHVTVTREVSLDETTKGAIEGLANAGAAALEQLVATSRTRESDAAGERKQLAKMLDGKDVQEAVRKDKSLAPTLKATQQAVADEDAAAKDRAALLKKAQADWSSELDALKALTG